MTHDYNRLLKKRTAPILEEIEKIEKLELTKKGLFEKLIEEKRKVELVKQGMSIRSLIVEFSYAQSRKGANKVFFESEIKMLQTELEGIEKEINLENAVKQMEEELKGDEDE